MKLYVLNLLLGKDDELLQWKARDLMLTNSAGSPINEKGGCA